MAKRIWIISGITLLLTAVLFVMLSSATGKTKTTPPTCCKKSNQCKEGNKADDPADLIIENLSRQFIFVIPATN